MSNRAWMPLHITDYLADTGHLNAAEHGAYLMLIVHYWQNGSLPTDERLLARLARMTKAEWEDSRDVLAMLFGPGWTHKRIDAELAKADEIIEKRRNAALGRHAKSKEDASGLHVQSTSTDTGVPPRTLNQEQKEEPSGSSKKRGCRLPADFVPDIGFAISLGLTRSQAESEAIRFREWWPAQPGQKGVKLDWGLTWQTWCRRKADEIAKPRGSPATSKPERPDHFANYSRELSNGQDRSHGSDSRNWDDAQGVPVLTIDYERR